ncbi:hypothetical protein XFF6166_10107 [Xanthomonas citri pv. fuscans]|nr:hypothetical protein XFF6166_10107 [Xanthomonas citri pv. fuscans]SOO02283.1 hypothetical protein XFF6960_590098 [Xanthomonas citri pv. fuscans]SOO06700.1 hypothetical protein XFF7767_80109 [Xanthomonas citri pv. fuscans]SOO11179.1 hypothetical protein XFF6970_70109 [Xanthomonas citri pv. fuscans]SOO16256.1 hypothetical protein XFF7766_770109 [Xanthomonas citri pv. fuscans]
MSVGALEPLPSGGKALLARHWRACLGAPALLARAGARSGGWAEGTSEAHVLFEVHVASHVPLIRLFGHLLPRRRTMPRWEKGHLTA